MIVLSVNKHSLNVCLKKYAILMQLYVEVWGGEFFFEEIREASKSKPNLKKKTYQARVMMVALFYPVLARGKLSVSPQDCVFVVWAGIFIVGDSTYKFLIFVYFIMFLFSKNSECNVWYVSGLRGALGIALALGLTSLSIMPQSVSNEILVQVVGCVTLTLLFNATTAKAVLSYLGI